MDYYNPVILLKDIIQIIVVCKVYKSAGCD